MATVSDLLELLEATPLSASELTRRLGVSQPTVSRLVRAAEDRIVRLGRGRATRYARAAPVFETVLQVPLFVVDERGRLAEIGSLHGLSHGGYLFSPADVADPFWLLGLGGDGLFESLPYFLYDLCPAGFLGRQLARRLAAEWAFPADPRSWTDRQIGQFLSRRGDDVPGNLVVGEGAALRVNQRQVPRLGDREAAYPELALRALAEGEPGSSAAGEQPKFTAYCETAGHLIVKFSSAAEGPEAQRGRDLLRAEAHALRCIDRWGLPAAACAVYTFGQRTLLESQRFDRVGERGRLPAVSLRMVDAEFGGEPRSWTSAAQALHAARLLDDTSFRNILWLETFGAWIGNSDRHLGNIALRPEGQHFSLYPAYDMLPMAYAPRAGELPEIVLRPPLRSVLNGPVWEPTRVAAVDFWSALADDAQLSDAFRAISAANAATLVGHAE